MMNYELKAPKPPKGGVELRSIIGCTSAIEASFIALCLHDNC